MTEGAADAGEDLLAFLRDVPLFAELSPQLHSEVALEAELLHVRAGDVVFCQGEHGESLYVVRSGRLEVVRDGEVLEVLGRGASFGELALLSGGPRSASVRAARDTELICVGRDRFVALLQRSPTFALALTRVLARWLQSGNVHASARPAQAVLTVAPGQHDLPVAPFLDAFLTALRRCGTAVVLAPPDVSGEPAALGRLLDQVEQDHDRVVLLMEPGLQPSEWNAFCLRQADRVVVLTRPGSPPPQSRPLPGDRSCDLVFYGERAPASARRPWLDAFAPVAHYHVPPAAALPTAVEQLVRRLTGRAVGVVLSGGGARGLAHIGVLERLSEAGVVIDRVGGCSMGAFVAGLWATGMSPAMSLACAREELADRRPFADYTVPQVALIKGRRAKEMLRRVFGDVHIEELPLDYFCVTCDLVSAELVVHRRGPLWEQIAVSISLPAYAPPAPRGERLLVDGGVLDNLPVRTMTETGEGPVIAVDVVGRRFARRAYSPDSSPRRRVFPARDERVPGIAETIARSVVLSSWRELEDSRALASLVITPELHDVGLFAFGEIDRLVEAGRQAADAVLDQALALSSP